MPQIIQGMRFPFSLSKLAVTLLEGGKGIRRINEIALKRSLKESKMVKN